MVIYKALNANVKVNRSISSSIGNHFRSRASLILTYLKQNHPKHFGLTVVDFSYMLITVLSIKLAQ